MKRVIRALIHEAVGGWQWSTGTGTDGAPYFPILIPTTQAEKFDPRGDFILRWIPELAPMPDEFIHEPWMDPLNVGTCQALLGLHEEPRRKALTVLVKVED